MHKTDIKARLDKREAKKNIETAEAHAMYAEQVKPLCVDVALSGASYALIAEELGMSVSTLAKLRVENPSFDAALENAMLQGASIVLDELRIIPYTEPDVARARLKTILPCQNGWANWCKSHIVCRMTRPSSSA